METGTSVCRCSSRRGDPANAAFHLQPARHAVLDHANAAVGRADPEVRVVILEQENDFVAGQSRRVVDVENGERLPVKTHQAVQCAEPEIAGARLGNGDDGTLRQTVRRAPDIHDEGRFNRRRAPDEPRRHHQAKQPNM
jgi:hypothetical protein